MPTFRCKIANPDGGLVEKTLISESKGALKSFLEEEGNFVLHIQKLEGSDDFFSRASFRRRYKSKDFLSFNQEFLVLLKAGLPVVAAMDSIIEKGGKGEFNALLQNIRDDVSTGESLSASFEKHAHLFSNLYIASLKAGERSGNIPLTISRYITYMKKTMAIRKKIVSASVYPLILTVASLFVLVFLLVYVVPAFTSTYSDTGTQLPWLTTVLIDFSHLLRSHFIYILTILALGGGALAYMRSLEKGRIHIDRWKLTLPFIGELYQHYFLSILARTLAMVLKSGMPLLESMQIAAGTFSNQYLRQHLRSSLKNLEEGSGFAEALRQAGIMPPLAIRMIAAGETAGALEQVLEEIADYYESDVDTRLSIIATAVEPVLMIMMGFLIGFIVLAMYLPIFQLAGTIS